MNDFTGFSFGGIHSSSLNLIVVSDGNRYSKDLFPPIQDYTLEKTGDDGSYYFGSNYKQKDFNVNFAFDSLTEVNLRSLRSFFDAKTIKDLIFDEEPYKVYSAKVTSIPEINCLCFGTGENKRIYKGEGSVTLTAFYPYARSLYNYSDSYLIGTYPNKEEWRTASGMLANQGTTPIYDALINTNQQIRVSNRGDIPTDFILTIPSIDYSGKTSLIIDLFPSLVNVPGSVVSSFTLDITDLKDSVNVTVGNIIIDTKKQLITFKTATKTVIINDRLSAGSLYKLPVISSIADSYIFQITMSPAAVFPMTINDVIIYNHLYF